jgi:hypothetical protein
MLSFNNFILEGGNVRIGDVEATRIDLNKMNRTEIVRKLDRSLQVINAHFKRMTGSPLWVKELFKSRKFLSGSSIHFFNKAIPDTEFRTLKPTVGDIDTQVDKNMTADVEKWLNSLGDSKLGYLRFVGYKKSPGQFITLWNVEGTDLNVQIDLEMVEFKDSFPTAWSNFSHSSSWDDIKASVKGVFHKYLLRALSAKSLREVTILKGKAKTPTKIMATDLAFSVTAGLRYKLQPTDQEGVYVEIPTKSSEYMTELDVIFKTFFGHTPSPAELKQFESFVGLLDLVNKNYSTSEKDKVVKGFAYSLWGKGAQKLVRGNPTEDFETKKVAFDLMLKVLKKKEPSEVQVWRDEFYRSYT